MNESKISIAEIEVLRKKADAERQIRQEVKEDISKLQVLDEDISAERQMRILRRGNINEIREMLQAYAGGDTLMVRIGCKPSPMMSPEAQLYIYENMQKGLYYHMCEFMLKRVPYTDELAERLIKDGAFDAEQKLSEKVERFYLAYKLNHPKCENATSGRNFFLFFFADIKEYFSKYDLTLENEVFLIEKYLNPRPLRDSYIYSCYEVVSLYMDIKKTLHIASEKALIASGNHDLIMKYIKIAEGGLKAEEELLDRGNREEVTAYFERYATL